MISCRRATRWLSDGLDRPLSWFQRLLLGLHLLGCRACCRFRRAVRWLHRSLSSVTRDVRLPADARQRLQEALDRAAREG
jgi:hypothetical protein